MSDSPHDGGNKFETDLIDFVREHPSIYKQKDENTTVSNQIWEEFAKKGEYEYSAFYCKCRWRAIRNKYLKERDRSLKTKKYKHLDRRLSFLDSLPRRTFTKKDGKTSKITKKKTINKKKNKRAIAKSQETGGKKSGIDKSSTKCGRMENFTNFEKEIIDFVRVYPILYDTRVKRFKGVLDTKLWKIIGANLKVSAQVCKERWNVMKDNYVEIAMNSNEVNKTHEKYLNGPLSFLKPIVEQLKVEKTVNKTDTQREADKMKTDVNTEETLEIDKFETTETVMDLNKKLELDIVDAITGSNNLNHTIESSEPKLLKFKMTCTDTLETDMNKFQLMDMEVDNIGTNNNYDTLVVDFGTTDSIETMELGTTNTSATSMELAKIETGKDTLPTVTLTQLQSPEITATESNSQDSSDGMSIDKNYDDLYIADLLKNANLQTSLPKGSNTTRIDKAFMNLICISGTPYFNKFEVRLINYIRKHPIIYDTRATLRDVPHHKPREHMKLWKILSDKLQQSEFVCHDNWMKLKLEYFRVRKLQDKGFGPHPSFSKYLDGTFTFLEPMYQHIKENALNVFTDNPLFERLENGKEKKKREEFDLAIIELIKECRVIWDKRYKCQSSREFYNAVWEDIAIKLGTSSSRCRSRWRTLKAQYKTHILKKAKGETDPSNFVSNKRNMAMNFLDKALEHEIPRNRKTGFTDYSSDSESKNSGNDIFAPALQDLLLSKSAIGPKPKDLGDCSVIISDDEEESVKNDDLFKCKPTEDDRTTLNSTLQPDSKKSMMEFFKGIGRYVANNFPEEKQKKIQFKSWALVTKLELEMLQED